MRGWARAACLLLPPPQAFASSGGHAGAGCRHSLHSAHGMASQLPLPPPFDSSRLFPRKRSPPPQPVVPAQEARCLSPTPGMVSFPAPSLLPGFAVWTLTSAPGSLQLSSRGLYPSSNHCVSIFPLGSRCFSLLSSWVLIAFSRPLTSACLSVCLSEDWLGTPSWFCRYLGFSLACQASSLASNLGSQSRGSCVCLGLPWPSLS